MFAGAENSIHAKDPNNKDAPGTLTQFMTTIANNYPVQYLQVLSKFIPQQINAQTETTVEIVYNSIDDVKRALEDAGMPLKQIEQLKSYSPSTTSSTLKQKKSVRREPRPGMRSSR